MLPDNLLRFFGIKEGPSQEQTEFLPAALEIVETPPSPLGRAIAATIILFLLIALAWACLGSTDIIAVAPGKIVSSQRTKTIQPFETGVIRAIHIKDGQAVKAGDILIEIDSTINQSERDRLAQELLDQKLEIARLTAATNLTNKSAILKIPDGATPEQITLQQNYLINQLNEIHAKLDALDRQIAQSEGNRAAVSATIGKLQESIPLLEQRNNIHQQLAQKGYGSKLDAINSQQDLIEHQHELIEQQGRLAEANGALAALKQQRGQAQAEYLRDNSNKLADAEQKANSLQEQLVQATQKFKLQTITAPVSGTVQQLSVHTEGGVVTPAQALLAIVPTDDHMEIEAMVSNRDIGFVHEGQGAAVKIDTFNFTKYGLLHGKIISISQDAIPRSKPADPSLNHQQTGAEDETSEPRGQELVYAARISLDRSQMQVEDRLVTLTPGMAVTAEIKTGKRPVIEYLLSPLAKHQEQAFKER